MKKNKTTKLLISFITCVIAFTIGNIVNDFLGIKDKKFLSLDFALCIVIIAISLITFEFLIYKITGISGIWRKRINSNE